MANIRFRDDLILSYKNYIEQIYEQENSDKEGSVIKDYINDAQARGNINTVIQGNSNYNTLFQTIKNYWTKQIPLIKNKPKEQLSPEETTMLDTIESQFKTDDPKEVENYAMKKILSEHSKEISYQTDKKTIVITGYTETDYDKSIKTK